MFGKRRREAREKYKHYEKIFIEARQNAEIVNLINDIFEDVDNKVKILAQITESK